MRSVWTEVRNTIAPPADDRHGPLPPLLLGLTVVTGLVDAFSYLVLGHVFVANMTGNVVFLGFALAGASGFSTAASLVALGAFCLGALVGGRLATELRAHRGRLLTVGLAIEVPLVAVAMVVAEVAGQPGSGAVRYGLISLLAVALGTQNAVVRRLAVPDLTTTVLTLTITGMFADTRWVGGAGARVGRRLLSTLGMFLGAWAGAALVLRSDPPLAILVALIVLCLVTATAVLVSRGDRPWALESGSGA